LREKEARVGAASREARGQCGRRLPNALGKGGRALGVRPLEPVRSGGKPNRLARL